MNYSLAKQILNKPHLLGHAVGYTKLTELHDKWIKYIWNTTEDRTLQAHRGSYKTASIIILGSLIFCLFNPGKRIFILRKKFQDNIAPIFSRMDTILKTDEMRYVFQELWGAPLEYDATANTITFHPPKDLRVGSEANITGAAIGQSFTGQHYDRILTDDIIGPKDRVSHAERERVKLVYQELLNIADPGCPISNVGTPWHKADAFSIMPSPLQFPVSKTGLSEFTEKHIKKLRNGMTPALYAANYELKHISSDDAVFQNIQFYDKKPDGLSWVGHIDARYSGDHTTAITFCAKAGAYVVLVGWAFDKHVDECLSFLREKISEYRCGTVWLETNADKGYLARDIMKFHPVVNTYHESMNKHVKIMQFLKPIFDKVYFLDDTNECYINQIADYVEGLEPDDAPDSAASIIRQYIGQSAEDLEILIA